MFNIRKKVKDLIARMSMQQEIIRGEQTDLKTKLRTNDQYFKNRTM